MKTVFVRRSVSRLTTVLFYALGLHATSFPNEPTVTLSMPATDVESLAQSTAPDHTGVIVTSAGRQILLPPLADTQLWKSGRTASGAGRGIALRDNRWSQGLFKLDPDPLATGAPVEKAALRFKVSGVERAGHNATFVCHRMLVDWSEDATWFQPLPGQPQTWDGLKPGVHFDAKPFARVELAALKNGDAVEIAGFEDAVRSWQSGQWRNYGFLLLMNGRALQVSVPSREAVASAPRDFALGGALDGRVRVRFDAGLFDRVLLRPDDLREAALRVRVVNHDKIERGTRLTVREGAREGSAIATMELGSVPADGWVEIRGVEKGLRGEGERSLLLSAEGKTPVVIAGMAVNSTKLNLALVVRSHPKTLLFPNPIQPQTGVFTTVKDGHLFYGGQRLRLWGTLGGVGDADRLRRMGFNAWRMWGPDWKKTYDADSIRRGEFAPVTQGDGSALDAFDKHYATLKENGMFIMATQLLSFGPTELLVRDDSFIAGGDDWTAWKAAMAGVKGEIGWFVYFDERLQKAKKQHAANFLNHVNPYTGRRYAVEEAIAIYELNNENQFVPQALNGAFKKWPVYFQKKVERRWNDWLVARYKSADALRGAWGKLADGEAMGSVRLGPDATERAKFPEQRGSDFIRFVIELADAWNQELREFARAQAPAGAGVAVAPFSFDTQFRPSLQWLHSITRGDVANFGMYFWSLRSMLARPPSLYVLDSSTVHGKPVVLYETNAGRPSAYRSEYPLMLAAFANWQDWDAIFFHYWGAPPPVTPDEQLLLASLLYPHESHYWTGVHHFSDPVMCSAMAMAGRMFLNHAVKPAADPAIYDAGGGAIFNHKYINDVTLRETAFSRGSAIRFAPESDGKVTVAGAEPPQGGQVTAAVASGEQILWDWPNERLIVDAPAFKAYVGKTVPGYKFKDGTVLSDVSTPWVCFAMTSADGQPLDTAKRILISAVADARNTGFKIDLTKDLGGPLNQARAMLSHGRAPVIQDPVACTLHFPRKLDATFRSYDFALREVAQTPIAQSNRITHDGRPLFLAALDISSRGEQVETPAVAAIASVKAAIPATVAGGKPEPIGAGAEGVWNPMPGVRWTMDAETTERVLRGSKLAFAHLSGGTDAAGNKTLLLIDAKVLWESPADIQLTFVKGAMQQIEATFKQPPQFSAAVGDYEKQFGAPRTKSIVSQDQTSNVTWRNTAGGAPLDVTLTETQGTLRAIYRLGMP